MMNEEEIKRRDKLHKVLELIDLSEAYVTQEDKQQDITILLGNTKAGKSTIINYLLGNKLIVLYNDYSQKASIQLLQEESEDSQNYAGIGIGALSKTTFPHKFISLNKMILWDTPGIDDNRGEVLDIPNIYSIQKLLSNSKSVRFVLISDYNDISSDNVGKFIKFINSICTMLPDINTFARNGGVSFIFTKVDDTVPKQKLKSSGLTKHDFLKQKVEKLLDYKVVQSVSESKSADSKNDSINKIAIHNSGKELLEYFINHKENIALWYKAKDEDQKILFLNNLDLKPYTAEVEEVEEKSKYSAIIYRETENEEKSVELTTKYYNLTEPPCPDPSAYDTVDLLELIARGQPIEKLGNINLGISEGSKLFLQQSYLDLKNTSEWNALLLKIEKEYNTKLENIKIRISNSLSLEELDTCQKEIDALYRLLVYPERNTLLNTMIHFCSVNEVLLNDTINFVYKQEQLISFLKEALGTCDYEEIMLNILKNYNQVSGKLRYEDINIEFKKGNLTQKQVESANGKLTEEIKKCDKELKAAAQQIEDLNRQIAGTSIIPSFKGTAVATTLVGGIAEGGVAAYAVYAGATIAAGPAFAIGGGVAFVGYGAHHIYTQWEKKSHLQSKQKSEEKNQETLSAKIQKQQDKKKSIEATIKQINKNFEKYTEDLKNCFADYSKVTNKVEKEACDAKMKEIEELIKKATEELAKCTDAQRKLSAEKIYSDSDGLDKIDQKGQELFAEFIKEKKLDVQGDILMPKLEKLNDTKIKLHSAQEEYILIKNSHLNIMKEYIEKLLSESALEQDISEKKQAYDRSFNEYQDKRNKKLILEARLDNLQREYDAEQGIQHRYGEEENLEAKIEININYCIEQEYDNEILNHPGLLQEFTKIYGANACSRLIDLGNELNKEEVTDICNLPDALEILGACVGAELSF